MPADQTNVTAAPLTATWKPVAGSSRPEATWSAGAAGDGRAAARPQNEAGLMPAPVGGRPNTAAPNAVQALHGQGVSLWLDYLSRDMLGGDLQQMIARDGLRGETSNPTIFEKAIAGGKTYGAEIKQLAAQGKTAEQICWQLMTEDVQKACDVFKPLYGQSGGKDGFVSLELDPTMARDPQKALAQARELWAKVDRPNLMIKVPATKESLPVIEDLIADGMNVNVTLLFDTDRHGEVIDRFMAGLERRAAQGKPLDHIASVASFFISRVDSEVDKRLDKIAAERPDAAPRVAGLHGKVAVANARLAYELFNDRFSSDRWKALEAKGAQVQRPLWASTGTKNKAYPDTLYVHDLIGPNCVNTAPSETIDAFRDHGVAERTLNGAALQSAHAVMDEVKALGIDMPQVTASVLEPEGVQKFIDSYHALLAAVQKQM
jgi:transaldolase